MKTENVFAIGGRQAVRPPKDDPWASMLKGLDMFTDDFLVDGVDDLPVQERDAL